MKFSDLGLNPDLLQGLKRLQHTIPTEVQYQVIPLAIAGKDLVVSSHTGSGKTGAFLLPILHCLSLQTAEDRHATQPQVLILTPTRELALQIEKNIHAYAGGAKSPRTVCLIGGAPFDQQVKSLRRGVEIVVATPGRLLDHLSRQEFLGNIRTLVLDEADRMLDMGFTEDIEAIVERLSEHQTLLFSATLDGKVANIASRYTRSPIRIEIHQKIDPGLLSQSAYFADDVRHKFLLLEAILNEDDVQQMIVFAATKAFVEDIAGELCAQGYRAAALHGDLPQRARSRVIRHTTENKVSVLVATDVAARGIDVEGISHVVNFDLPRDSENYIHRIGRTARAGRSGTSVSFVSKADRRRLQDIERKIGAPIEIREIPGLEPAQNKKTTAKSRIHRSRRENAGRRPRG